MVEWESMQDMKKSFLWSFVISDFVIFVLYKIYLVDLVSLIKSSSEDCFLSWNVLA